MNPIARAARAAGRSVKAGASGALRFVMRFGGMRGWAWLTTPGTAYDYERAVGEPRSNAVVAACINWICTTFPEAPIQVVQRTASGELVEQPDSDLLALLERPNAFYSGEHLWAALIADRELDGNGYAIKLRNGQGKPIELWWVPHTLIEPRWPVDGTEFISYYAYRPAGVGEPIIITREDVIHLRIGFDPDNIRKGLSPMKALLREIATDNEAANWTASLLRNVGVPPVVIAPDADVKLDNDGAEEIKALYQQKTTGDKRGEAMVMSAPTKVTVLGFNPQQMELTALRQVPEERISAVIGVPAIVAGLGAGLERSTFSNFREAREAAYESKIVPTQRIIAAELMAQLVPDFGDPKTLRIQFDLSKVRALQDDQNALHQRVRDDLTNGLITLNQALGMIGEDTIGTAGDVRFVPQHILPMKATDLLGLRELPVRSTVVLTSPEATQQVPEDVQEGFTVDESGKPAAPKPAIAPPAKGAQVRQLVKAAFVPEIADAVLTLLADVPAGVSPAEHGRTVIEEGRKMEAERTAIMSRNGH